MKDLCIYRKEYLKSDKVEHIVPAGLGGTLTLPKGYVSDEVNELFSKWEAKALRNSLVGGIRNYIGPGHRGKMTISKKLNPHINILKLEDSSTEKLPQAYKYRMGFMLDRKTVFIPQLIFEFDANLNCQRRIFRPGEFKTEYNDIQKFRLYIENASTNQMTIVQTEHIVPINCIIIGMFYDKIFCYVNVPFFNVTKTIQLIKTLMKEEIEICISRGGKYNFSYKIDGGIDNGIFQFLHMKIAFNVLAYKMGRDFVLKHQFDYVREKILRNDVKELLYENVDENIREWIQSRTENDAHYIIIKNVGGQLWAFVSIYGDMIYCMQLAREIDEDISFAFVSDWKNRKDYIEEFSKFFRGN